MPSISGLDLTMSRDTNGVVTARVDFELQFSEFEVVANVSVTERVALVRQVSVLDRWDLSGAGAAVQSQSGAGNQNDIPIAVLSSGVIDAASLGLSPSAGGSVTRSFTHVLTYAERDALLELGRDHPYAVVSVVPNGVSADLKLAAVEMLDVGGPDIVTTVDVGGVPTALAADGQRFYVATTGGEVVVFDRFGDQEERFAIGGNLSGLTYDGALFWAAVADGDIIKPFDKTGTLGTPRPTGGSQPVAVVASGSSIWVANAATRTVAQTTASGIASTTQVAGNPTALAVSAEGMVYAAVVNPDANGPHAVHAIDPTGNLNDTWTLGPRPRALAVYAPMLGIPEPVYTSEDALHLFPVGIAELPFGGPSRGVAVGGGAIWATLESDELAKYVGLAPGLASTYPVGAGADAVLWDTDRVYVANRVGRSVTIVRI